MKRILTFLLLLVMIAGLVACGEATGSTDSVGGTDSAVPGTGSVGGSSSDAVNSDDAEEEWKPGTEPNLVMACDQWNHRIVVYDMSLLDEEGNLDKAEVLEIHDAHTAGLKYREDTVYGDVVIYSPANIVSYPEGEVIWSVSGKSGSNPHSIEILPSGNIVTASSTDGQVAIFNTYANLKEGAALKVSYYSLPGAHGVLWDPENELVWAIGDYDLVAYQVREKDGVEILSKINGIGAKLPTTGGHDLSADLTDTNFLWCTTNSGVYHFDKEANEFITKFNQYAKLSKKSVKGFGNNRNGNFFFGFPNHGPGREWEKEGIADWCTDTIYYAYWKSENFLYVQPCVSEKSAFYKVRVLCGQYQ